MHEIKARFSPILYSTISNRVRPIKGTLIIYQSGGIRNGTYDIHNVYVQRYEPIIHYECT